MRRTFLLAVEILFCLTVTVAAQNKRLWVLRAPGEAVEYDVANFAEKQVVKIPAKALDSPQNFLVNHLGQILFASPAAFPLEESDIADLRNVWFWDGHSAATLTRDVSRSTATAGSNLAITESAPVPFLSADGKHLYWFSNQPRRLQRDGVDLSSKVAWTGWRTDLAGANREEIASIALPDCSCKTGTCEETCPYEQVWIPDEGVDDFFFVTQFVSGQTQAIYKSTSVYKESAGKWSAMPLVPPLRRVLDAPNAEAVLEAVPDTGCCGWSNESDDQTLLRLRGKVLTVFDELAAYKNADYDVSFYTQNGKVAPGSGSVAMTIVSTSKPNTPIQLAEQGQANPEESQAIRKTLLNLPAVEIKSVEAKSGEHAPQRLAFLPHSTLVGWLSEKEILIIQDHLLVVHDVASGSSRKSNIRVEDYEHVFLR
jgi:prepilin-type processing-associated H-X9-DG protein